MRIRGMENRELKVTIPGRVIIRLARSRKTCPLATRRITIDDEILVTEAHRAVNAWLYENPEY